MNAYKPGMRGKFLLLPTMLMTLILFFAVQTAHAQVSLDSDLEVFRTKYALPALAAAVVKNGRILAAGAVGTRKAGAKIPVTLNDRFHLGSDTKAMTALLAAMLIDEGSLRWESTMAEIFPELSDTMVSGLRGVTLEQLMSHTSGISPDNQAFVDLLFESAKQDGNLDELRYWLLRQWATQPLASEPGTTFAYANMNYVILGAIIERISGRTWDSLIRERIFAHIWLDTHRDFAMVVVTNIGGPKANEALFAIAPFLYKRFAGGKQEK